MPSGPSQMNSQWPKAQLPSGLGAGGRGKEKAPCRYLHYEIDWDSGDAGAEAKWEERPVKKPHRLALGLGPIGALEPPVSFIFRIYDVLIPVTPLSVSSAMDQLRRPEVRLLYPWQISRYHGRSPMGHPHERV